ncbi:MAG: MerR family transcriptional regulator, thiopeptide resistance regulator [Pseudonocardiales bacterium]|nr:MerR family transcriptional regulator, thiopeptide resistance regulator [Pseudonocardiales bacterium]
MTTSDDTPTVTDDERALATSLFNGVWELMEREDRTQDDDDRMLHMAHASRYHWGDVGTPANLARGEWLCSRVYAVLQRAEPSSYHAQRVLDICDRNSIGNWDRAFAFEALARAAAVGGETDAARAFIEQALAAAEDIDEGEERQLLLADLESIPGQPRFW